MRNTMVVLAVASAALLTSCADRGPESAPPSSSTTSTFTDAPTQAPQDALPKQQAPAGDAGVTVTGIRIGRQPGYDRVVYDLGGRGAPGWNVQYADRAVQDGSGRAIPVAGQSILQVQITGSAYPFDSGVEPYAGPDPATDPNAPGIAGVYGSAVYEGTTQSFIGVNADRPPFTVSTLSNPQRLVIDIATP
ncbi:hypothetical protein AB0H76_00680 [Nocardia sp. NPDC050712]|uniref:AMIN-like domain-containing (lipo)protein n=1 Tax=Nocardia sp. NPDC050712 TaxID=3155518 RepID=UPI0033D63D61